MLFLAMRILISFVCFLCLAKTQLLAQNTYFTFTYDNDFFTQTDKYYTQGIQLKYVSESFHQSFFNRLMFSLSGKPLLVQNGLKIQHAGFTPNNLGTSQIQVGDRPYAAYIYLGWFRQQQDTTSQISLTTELQLGTIGRAAFGEGMQKTIHAVIDDEQPKGWDNQIASDVIIGYSLKYERALLGKIDRSRVSMLATADLGTLLTAASLGARAEWNTNPKAKLRFRAYAIPYIQLVAYNATLQGGLFNQTSPYTIPAHKISRWLGRFQLGGELTYKRLSVGYTRDDISIEFTGVTRHRWGSVWVRVGF